MDIDIVLKLVGALVSIISVGKIVYELTLSQKIRLRDDYKFAKEFFEELAKTPAPHPLVVERGYHAIAGDRSLAVEEIQYLLTLENPSSALREYVLARDYLEHLPQSEPPKIRFKPKYAAEFARKWRQWVFMIGYSISAFLAISPLLFMAVFKVNSGVGPSIAILFAFGFGVPAYGFLMNYVRLKLGERLVSQQQCQEQKAVVDQATPSPLPDKLPD